MTLLLGMLITPVAVPEPASILLLLSGVGALGILAKRIKR